MIGPKVCPRRLSDGLLTRIEDKQKINDISFSQVTGYWFHWRIWTFRRQWWWKIFCLLSFACRWAIHPIWWMGCFDLILGVWPDLTQCLGYPRTDLSGALVCCLQHEFIMNSCDPFSYHYGDVIMGTIASQISSLTIVYSTIYSDADQRKHQSSASLAFVWGIHRAPVNSPHKWPVTWKMFPFDDVIMFCRVASLARGQSLFAHYMY